MQTIKNVPTIEVKKIDKVLKRDAKNQVLIAGYLARLPEDSQVKLTPQCKSVGRCAIGALLIDAGYPIKSVNQANESSLGHAAGKLLKNVYGLLPEHVEAIERVNDNVCGDSESREAQMMRYEEVMGLVTFAEVMQQNGVRFTDEEDLESTYENAAS